MESNRCFMCEVCGGDDYVPSQISISANFGSIHDGERLTLEVCGICLDRIIDLLAHIASEE